jgi:uncharacterized RDD family membrane protein YckC
MICGYCGGRNNDDEVRCRRCGRKADDTLNGEFILQQHGNLAAELRPAPQARVDRPAPNFAHAMQRQLFSGEPGYNVIPIGTVAPPRQRQRSAAPRKPRPVIQDPAQGSLELLPTATDKPRTLGTTVEAVIFCEDPVATLLHRAVAATIDGLIVLASYGLFLGVYAALGGGFPLTYQGLTMLALVIPVVAFLYGLTFAMACGETPGMQMTHLRVTTFDGFRPDRKQFLMRFAGSCLSKATVLGLLWSFADEENLAWQDHMSHTFPTPGMKSDKFLRR